MRGASRKTDGDVKESKGESQSIDADIVGALLHQLSGCC